MKTIVRIKKALWKRYIQTIKNSDNDEKLENNKIRETKTQ